MVRSFDIFDTLIARKCVHAHGIFSLIEQRTGISRFAQARGAAEKSLWGTDYTLDDIYMALARLSGLSGDTAERLKQIEIETELDNVLPIAGNISRVADGDLLITDMYLPLDVIRKMLERAGFSRHAPIYRSTAHKAQGIVWQSLEQLNLAMTHVGDNPQADGEIAARHGHGVELTAMAQLTPVEQFLVDNQLVGTALVSRALRLSVPPGDVVERELRLLQASLNIPLLIVASLCLRHEIHRSQQQRVLFSSRDCHLWIRIFGSLERVLGSIAESRYFFTSRAAKAGCSANYRDYLHAEIGQGAILADLSGTGMSAKRLLEQTGAAATLLFIYQIRTKEVFDFYRNIYPNGAPPQGIVSLIEGAEVDDSPIWDAWEILNYSTQGTTLDVKRVGDVFFPVNDQTEFTSTEFSMISQMNETAERATQLLADPFFAAQMVAADATRPPEKLKLVLRTLWHEIRKYPLPAIVFSEAHRRCNQMIFRLMADGASRSIPAQNAD